MRKTISVGSAVIGIGLVRRWRCFQAAQGDAMAARAAGIRADSARR